MLLKQKYIKIFFLYSFIFVTAIGFSNCGKNSRDGKYVAKVNDTFLADDQIVKMLDSVSDKTIRQEMLRKWVNDELIYQDAKKGGIESDKAYSILLEKAKKDIAIALWIKKNIVKEKLNIKDTELEIFFSGHKDSFRLKQKAYFTNIIVFRNEEKAMKFRNLVFEFDWKTALNQLSKDSLVIKNDFNVLKYEADFDAGNILRVCSELMPDEVSPVLNRGNGEFILVQVLKRYEKNEIPPFHVVKQDASEIFEGIKRQEMHENLLKKLYNSNDIEIKE